MWFGHSPSFWLAILGAILVKIVTSETHSFQRAVTTIIVAVFFAWAFTDAVVAYLNLDQEVFKTPAAALLALTGEGIARVMMSIKGFDDVIKLWRAFRGKDVSKD